MAVLFVSADQFEKVTDSVMEFDSIVNHNLDRGNQSMAGSMDTGVLDIAG